MKRGLDGASTQAPARARLASLLIESHCARGGAPTWDERDATLWWFDVEGCHLHMLAFDNTAASEEEHDLPDDSADCAAAATPGYDNDASAGHGGRRKRHGPPLSAADPRDEV